MTGVQTCALPISFDAATKVSKIYLNGNQVASGTIFTYEPYQLYEISKDIRNYIGRTQWWDTSYANDNIDYCGTIDQFRMYNIALTQDEIKLLEFNIPSELQANIKNNKITLESKMVKNELKISVDDHYLNSIIVISSLAGQVMIKSKIEMTNTIIPINLTSGIYIVNVI